MDSSIHFDEMTSDLNTIQELTFRFLIPLSEKWLLVGITTEGLDRQIILGIVF